ncbi:MAG: sensor histidine kinase [Proteobacteria bacterium]|nr:sensor histidine kinase [Pseudomonadota bacterium]
MAILRKIRPKKLETKLVLLIFALVFFLVTIIGSFSIRIISTLLEEQIGTRALKVSQTVSLIPEVQRGLIKGDLESSKIQEVAESIRKVTGAQFVVVGDKKGKRYSHPVKERVGLYMVGGDNSPALDQGKSYISKAVGTLGPSIRGKVPVFDDNGLVIGLVSVGYLIKNINTITTSYQLQILALMMFILVISIAVALRIARSVKRSIFNLEPHEIASLLLERTATLETIREGVIAVDSQGLITTINQAAFKTIGLDPTQNAVGQPIRKIFPGTKILEVLESGDAQLDKELIRHGFEIIANRIPIFNNGKVNGVVSSFRRKDELDILAKELSQVQKYSELLRGQTHEYSNKLHTIAGLIQIGAYDKAIELIGSETSGYQKLIQTLLNIVRDPILAGTIMGKYNRARELKVILEIDPNSSMSDIPPTIKREKIVTIIGNLLDNAFEAVLKMVESNRMVRLSMTDLGNDLIFEFDDSGGGVEEKNYENIFEKGFTTKEKQGSGMGLHLVEQALNILNGSISIGKSELGGVAVTVIIPKVQE